MNAFRSFEGEVYENLVYEKLLRYVNAHEHVEKFIVKGPHKKRTQPLPNTLSVNWKGQIVYRTRRKEIGEFDALIFTKHQLYFVEMTLVKSVTNLKRRLRKKKALLETIFPQYEIKALLVLSEGVTGVNHLPDYCTVWITKEYSAERVFEWLSDPRKPKRKPFERIKGKKIIGTANMKIKEFPYYSTLAWILKKSRSTGDDVLNLDFLTTKTLTRYHDLFTKIYVGYIEMDEFKRLYPSFKTTSQADKVYVSIEKEHTGALVLTYFMQHSKKRLDNILLKKGELSVQKKDPFGITVTEINHISKTVNTSHRLSAQDILDIQVLLEQHKG